MSRVCMLDLVIISWGVARLPEMINVFLRGVFSFLSLLILTRLMGKQQVSQLTFFDYITGITIGSIAASLTVDLDIQAIPAWVGLITWSLGPIAVGIIVTHSRKWRKIIGGEPTVVIQNGQILESNLEQMNYTVDDLRMQLRQAQAFRVADVEFAVLEPDGMLSVQMKSQLRPITPSDLQMPTNYEGLSTELIVDGHIVDANLTQLNLSREWLENQITGRGHRVVDVYYAEIDTKGDLYVDLRDDLDGLPQEQDISETSITGEEPIKETDRRGDE